MSKKSLRITASVMHAPRCGWPAHVRLLRVMPPVVALLLALGLMCAHPETAMAWKVGAHWAAAMSVKSQLPLGNTIRLAMEKYPNDVAWGSTGPDLPANDPLIAINNVPWFDAYHYDQTGRFAAALMQQALASTDPDRERQIAFAAGWITHVAGDMAVHGLYVVPESGVYIDPHSNHELHGSLEQWADVYVWTQIAKLNPQDYRPYTAGTGDVESTKLYNRFQSSLSPGTVQLLDRVNRQVVLEGLASGYHLTFLEDPNYYFGPEKMAAATLIFGLVTRTEQTGATSLWALLKDHSLPDLVSYLRANQIKIYMQEADAEEHLTIVRRERIQQAWAQTNEVARELLLDASRNDYSWYSDSWVLDAGMNDGRTVGSLKIVVATSGNAFAGTDKIPYFKMEYADGSTREWRLSHESNTLNLDYVSDAAYDDFEQGSRDVYYLHCPETFEISQVRSITLRLGTDGGNVGPDWTMRAFAVAMNNRWVYLSDSWDHAYAPGERRTAYQTTTFGTNSMFSSLWPQTHPNDIAAPSRRIIWVKPTGDAVFPGGTAFTMKVANPERVYRSTVEWGIPRGWDRWTKLGGVEAVQGSGLDWCTFTAAGSVVTTPGQIIDINFTAYEPAGSWGAQRRVTFRLLPLTLTLSVPSAPSYRSAVVSGYLRDQSGRPLAGQTISIFGNGLKVADVQTDADGRYAKTMTPTTATRYEARFAGTASLAAQVSVEITVTPRARLTRITSWTTLALGKTYYAKGYIEPTHNSGDAKLVVRAYKRRSNGTYPALSTPTKTFSAYSKYVYYSGSKAKYQVPVKLTSRGYWKLVVFHAADARNESTYGSADYIRVK